MDGLRRCVQDQLHAHPRQGQRAEGDFAAADYEVTDIYDVYRILKDVNEVIFFGETNSTGRLHVV
jgi:hypothetical protein